MSGVYSARIDADLTQPVGNTRATVSRTLRVAVASSGLGHIRRGIETWAADTALALHREGQDVTLFQGSGEPGEPWQLVVPCQRRFDPATQRWVRHLRRFGGWRYGFGNTYQAEQTTFTLGLWRRVRRDYDILHVQDPWIALLMDRLHRAGLSRPRVILAHGTEESPQSLQKFSYLQHLAPCYLEDWQAHRPAHQTVFAIPNFVDTSVFHPGDRCTARALWKLPADHLVILCVAAIKKHHKRVDYLLREFAAFADRLTQPATLIVAGGREAQTDDVIALGRDILGDRVRFLEGVERARMPTLYQAADVFALASLHEMMPIAMLEALASGLPVACNDTPTMRWMVGSAASPTDISYAGVLAAQLQALADPVLRAELSRQARAHAEAQFSETVVIQQMLQMYHQVAGQR